MEDKATVLVTGGTGFVARQVILQMLKKEYRVRATVRSLTSVYRSSLVRRKLIEQKKVKEAAGYTINIDEIRFEKGDFLIF